MIPSKGRSSRCVLLFARAPLQEERVKGIRGAAPLFAFTKRRLSEALASFPDVGVVISGEGTDGLFEGATVVAQRGRTFGERFENAFADARALGYVEVVAIPIDVPALGTEQLAASFAKLEGSDVVLGPSPDGGVYLVGSRRDTASLFRDVPWQTDRVFFALLRNAGEAVVLGSLLDIDRRADLESLAADASTDPELRSLVSQLLHRDLTGHPISAGSVRPLRLESHSFGRAPPLFLLSF